MARQPSGAGATRLPTLWIVIGVVAGACGDAAPKGQTIATAPELVVPTRSGTIGDLAWDTLPAGAEVVIELDLARLRTNPVVGAVVTRGLARLGTTGTGDLPLEMPAVPVAFLDALVMASYEVGTGAATTATMVLPSVGVDANTTFPMAVPVRDRWLLLAPPELQARVGVEPVLRTDRPLAALRARAMPAAAEGAALRLTARLAPGARTALTRLAGLEPAPRLVSGWADVADDAALVLEIDASEPRDAAPSERLIPALRALLDTVGGVEVVRALGLVPALERTTITAFEPWVRMITLVSPERLRRVVGRAQLGLPVATDVASDRLPVPPPASPEEKTAP